MKITCPKCKAKLLIPDDKLKPGGMKFKCSKCGASLSYKKKEEKSAGDSLPEPGPPPEPAAAPELPPAPPLPELQTGQPDQEKEREAVKILRDTAPPAGAGPRLSRNAVLAISGAAVIVIIVIGVFLFKSDDGENQRPAGVPPAVSIPQPPPVAPAAPADTSGAPEAPPPPTGAPPSATTDEGPIDTGEKAIEKVKRSDALLRRTTVQAIVSKWTTDNTGRYTIVGWQAKKMDENNYLVSYTAREGDRTVGFYFNLDVQTGEVQDIARNKELQTKYNINY